MSAQQLSFETHLPEQSLVTEVLPPQEVDSSHSQYKLTGIMHRLFAHKSYKVVKPVRILLAIAGSMTGEAPILEYTAYHRCHHIYADRQGDLHSPHYFSAKNP